MKELIDSISIGTAADATPEQKATGAAACRTILAALDTPVGDPLTLPGGASRTSMRPSLDQLLDLAIARLSMIAASREPSTTGAESVQPGPPPSSPMRIPMVPSVGLRGGTTVTPRRATAGQQARSTTPPIRSKPATPKRSQ